MVHFFFGNLGHLCVTSLLTPLDLPLTLTIPTSLTLINLGEGRRQTAFRGLERKAKSWSFLLASFPGLAFFKADGQLLCPEDSESQKVNTKALRYFSKDQTQASGWEGNGGVLKAEHSS